MSKLLKELKKQLEEKDKEIERWKAHKEWDCKTMQAQGDMIEELEAKLAESEKGNDEWVKICDGKLETINRLIEEKHELEEIITNKSHNKWLKAEAERYKNEYQSLKGYIDQLKQQLAEKEERIGKLNYEITMKNMDYYIEGAIAELNNILDTFAIFVNEEKESMVSPDGSGNLSLLEYIENRINTLKGEHKC